MSLTVFCFFMCFSLTSVFRHVHSASLVTQVAVLTGNVSIWRPGRKFLWRPGAALRPELTRPVPCRRRRPAGRLRGLLPWLMQLPRQRTRGREADRGFFARGLFPLLPHSSGGGSVTSEPAHGSSDAFTSCQACRINVCHRGIVFPQQLISTGGKKKKSIVQCG